MVEIVWEFQVREGAEKAFEFHYSSTGTWALLFATSAKFHGTKLLREQGGKLRYMTVDTWESHADFVTFRTEHTERYSEIDKECDRLTEMERLVGVFEIIG